MTLLLLESILSYYTMHLDISKQEINIIILSYNYKTVSKLLILCSLLVIGQESISCTRSIFCQCFIESIQKKNGDHQEFTLCGNYKKFAIWICHTLSVGSVNGKTDGRCADNTSNNTFIYLVLSDQQNFCSNHFLDIP